eukprot:767470-Hanusia_phi.AAC.2
MLEVEPALAVSSTSPAVLSNRFDSHGRQCVVTLIAGRDCPTATVSCLSRFNGEVSIREPASSIGQCAGIRTSSRAHGAHVTAYRSSSPLVAPHWRHAGPAIEQHRGARNEVGEQAEARRLSHLIRSSCLAPRLLQQDAISTVPAVPEPGPQQHLRRRGDTAGRSAEDLSFDPDPQRGQQRDRSVLGEGEEGADGQQDTMGPPDSHRSSRIVNICRLLISGETASAMRAFERCRPVSHRFAVLAFSSSGLLTGADSARA